jgi:type IV pilus assembly protein PilB
VVLRILDKTKALKRLDELGFDESNLVLYRNLVTKPYGIFLVTGPTGSGKTTSLYAALQELKSVKNNIMTCEDPVEYDIPGLNQSQINEKTGLTFDLQLRAILRQDPDVVLVGEIRDAETAQTAMRAAMTGHLVLSTLHTNDAPSAIPRLRDMGIDPFLISNSLVGVMSQRLIRRICPHCTEEYEASDFEYDLLRAHVPIHSRPILKRAVGCTKCYSSGYSGRMGTHEILPIEGELRDLIAEGAGLQRLRQGATAIGYRTIQEDCLTRVLAGETSIQEAMRVIYFETLNVSAKGNNENHLKIA